MRRLASERGFTVVELLTTLVVTGMFAALILFFGISYWRYGFLLEADLDTLVTRLNAQDVMREQLGSSSGLIVQNSILDNNPLVPDPAQPGGKYWIPLHAVPGNTLASGSGYAPLLYFKRYATSSSGGYIFNGLNVYENEFIFYINRSSRQLFMRSLANPAAAGNALKTSCPPSLASASCPADKLVASDLSSIDRRYFSRSGTLIDFTTYLNGNGTCSGGQEGQYNGQYDGCGAFDFPGVEVVELTLNLAKKPVFQTTSATQNSTVVRIALRNK